MGQNLLVINTLCRCLTLKKHEACQKLVLSRSIYFRNKQFVNALKITNARKYELCREPM